MIQRVWFREFRALRQVDLTLEPLTVIVGPNGSGKTSILEGIEQVFQVAGRSTREVLSRIWRADRNRSAEQHVATELGIAFGGHGPPAQLLVAYTPTEPVHRDAEYRSTVRYQGKEFTDTQGAPMLGVAPPPFLSFLSSIGRALILRLDASRIGAPSYLEGNTPEMLPSGEGLATVLADLAAREPDRLELIQRALKEIVPTVRRVRVERCKVVRHQQTSLLFAEPGPLEGGYIVLGWGHRVVMDMVNGADIHLAACGEGTAYALALITFLYGSQSVSTVLLDDIDRGLHPKAQQDLVKVLRAVMTSRPNLQVVATTHSPYLLDEVNFNEVRLTTLADDGSVIAKPLTAHPDFEQWKDHVRPGELWTANLEDWLKARTAAEAP